MICWSAKRRSSDYVDGRLRASERSRVEAHLRECASCALRFEQIRQVRSASGRLPRVWAPARLRTALRVSASRERQAIVNHQGSPLKRLWDHWKFRLDEVMRPLTIPATGGLASSFILFSLFAFTIGSRAQMVNYEVPVLYADHTIANLVPLELRSSVTLTLSLDSNGHITDYAVQDGKDSFVGDATRLQDNNISMPSFPSVLALAQPVNSDISILFKPIVFRQ